MNKYKIDANIYLSGSFPYALYVKRAWWRRWEHLDSFETVEKAQAAYARLAAMPIYLGDGLDNVKGDG